MVQPLPVEQDHTPGAAHGLRFDWLRASIASGFIATFVLTVCIAAAFGFANAVGDADGNGLERHFAALSSNELTENVGDTFAVGMVTNLAVGLLWAMIYARWAEPRLDGPGWRRGALFSLIPFVLSIVVFFPIAGIGMFGHEADAGIFPVFGNLVLHLIYGVTLGTLYAIDAWSGIGSSDQDAMANSNSERAAAIGVAAGGVIGFAGGWLVSPAFDDLGSSPTIALAGALTGAAIGMLLGSFLGLRVDDEP